MIAARDVLLTATMRSQSGFNRYCVCQAHDVGDLEMHILDHFLELTVFASHVTNVLSVTSLRSRLPTQGPDSIQNVLHLTVEVQHLMAFSNWPTAELHHRYGVSVVLCL